MPTTKKMKPPKSLISPVVVALWNKLVKHLGPLHVLAVTDEEALLHLCNLHAHCAKRSGTCQRQWDTLRD